jgi:hypothetical protein
MVEVQKLYCFLFKIKIGEVLMAVVGFSLIIPSCEIRGKRANHFFYINGLHQLTT